MYTNDQLILFRWIVETDGGLGGSSSYVSSSNKPEEVSKDSTNSSLSSSFSFTFVL